MCLDVNHHVNKHNVKETTTGDNQNSQNSDIASRTDIFGRNMENSIVRVCGGNLHNLPPVFDKSGE